MVETFCVVACFVSLVVNYFRGNKHWPKMNLCFPWPILRESLVVAVQQVQSAVSSEEHSSEEAQSDTQGSAFSLGIPGGSGPKRAETFSGFDSRLKPDSKDVYRASSMRTERPGLSFPSRQIPGSISPVAGGSPKIKHKRRPSGGGWSFLKSSNKDEKDQSASTGTEEGWVGAFTDIGRRGGRGVHTRQDHSLQSFEGYMYSTRTCAYPSKVRRSYH